MPQRELQLVLQAFDPAAGPACKDEPGKNGFRLLCYQCPFSERGGRRVFCTRYRKVILTRDKYGLPLWNMLRKEILARDGRSCRICGSGRNLAVHHINQDRTCDDPGNLITVCEACHSRFHSPSGRVRYIR